MEIIQHSPAASLILFGRRFSRGLACRRWILKIYHTIVYSLLIHQAVDERNTPKFPQLI
jgi:hypothetical protein